MTIKWTEEHQPILNIEGKEFSLRELLLYSEIERTKEYAPEQFAMIKQQYEQVVKDLNENKLNEEQKQQIEEIQNFAKEKGIDEIIYFGMVNLNNFLVNKVIDKVNTNQTLKKEMEEGKVFISDIFDLNSNLNIFLSVPNLYIATPLMTEEASKFSTKIKYF